MGRNEFYDYIRENFTLDATALNLIDNILFYVESRFEEIEDQHIALKDLLAGFGLNDDEIERVRL